MTKKSNYSEHPLIFAMDHWYYKIEPCLECERIANERQRLDGEDTSHLDCEYDFLNVISLLILGIKWGDT